MFGAIGLVAVGMIGMVSRVWSLSSSLDHARQDIDTEITICAVSPTTALLRSDCCDELIHSLRGDSSHLLVGPVLDRVLDEDPLRVEPDRFALNVGGFFEHRRRDKHRREAAAFKVTAVVHTARRTAASIGERFDHGVA